MAADRTDLPDSGRARQRGAAPRPARAAAPPVSRRQAVALVERIAALDERHATLLFQRAADAPPVAEHRPAAAGQVAALVNRLLALEQRLFAPPPAAPQAPPPRAMFEPPHDPHPWPRRSHPDAPPGPDPYDLRPDDSVIPEIARGAAFLARFRLRQQDADFAGARASLAALPPALRPAAPGETPDASIIIPVHGQLGHTLNCLDSLYRHATSARVELIVVDDASPDATAAVLAGLPHLILLRQPGNAGFVASCNAGAAHATGRVIVLLNNDTRVVEGWLDALLARLARRPDAGLVGAKLFNPDASLQEAGGILWRDGSAWNYGRGDDPNRPQYCHAREVDFVSGASIAVPRAIWQDMGGLDPHFAPAYGEDADLALRIRQSGRTVWFEPQARVIHDEGATAGRDLTRGVKAWQTVHTAKLAVRWHARLATHRRNGEAAYFERDRGWHRRALVIDATTPTPQQDAGSVTTVMHLELLQELGFKTWFIPQDNALFQPGPTGALHALGVECLTAPYAVGIEAILRHYGPLFDVVLVFRVGVLEAVLPAIRAHAPQATLLFNNMDLHFLRLRREAELAGDAEGLARAAALQTRELSLMRQTDCTMTPSSFELAEIARLAPDTPARVMPFITPFHGTAVPFAARRDLCFLGGYRHSPNVDAVRWFVRDILPRLWAELPALRFIIAGAHPGPEVRALAGPRVVVTGLVEDLRDVFDATRVFACPLRAGAGVKGKLATAMSYGLPVVTTPIGAEGMDLDDGWHALIAEDAAAFAAACLALYRDAALWQRLSLAGQDKMQRDFSRAAGVRALREGIEVGMGVRLVGKEGSTSFL